jgi:hypothetical protein
MNAQEIIAKVSKYKEMLEAESDSDIRARYQKKIKELEASLEEVEKKVEKLEEKVATEEKKELSEAEKKIRKYQDFLDNESDPDLKARYQKKIKELQDSLKEVKEEIKVEKKEVAEQKAEIKKAAKVVKAAKATKVERKEAVKKVEKKVRERKEVSVKRTRRGKKIKEIIDELDKLIAKNKKLKEKYAGKGVDVKRDAGRSAKPFGYRFVGKHDYRVPTADQIKKGKKRGTIDYEGRPNRSDVYPKRAAKLADGGNVKDSAVVALVTAQIYNTKTKEFVGKERVEKIRKGNEIFSDAFSRHTPFAESTQEKIVKNKYEEYWNDEEAKKDEVIKVKKVEITEDGRKPHYYADGGKTQGYDDREDERLGMEHGKLSSKDLDSTHARRDDARFEERGKMAKGGRVGHSKEDKARFAKPAGWRWKEIAVTKRIIERKQLSMQPSKKMRDKYPDYVYYEDRLNKADKKPSRKYLSE